MAARGDNARPSSETSDEGLRPRAVHHRGLDVVENDIDAAVGQYALLELVP